MALPIRQIIFNEAQKITQTQAKEYELMKFAEGGYVSPNYWTPDSFSPPAYHTVHLRNKEGQQISMQVNTNDNTVSVDFDALMEMMRMAGFE